MSQTASENNMSPVQQRNEDLATNYLRCRAAEKALRDAAPEMLAALSEVDAAFSDPLGYTGSYSRRSKALQAVRVAIAKARGTP